MNVYTSITVRELRANLSKYLSEGCTVVDGKSGRVLAVICRAGQIEELEKELAETKRMLNEAVSEFGSTTSSEGTMTLGTIEGSVKEKVAGLRDLISNTHNVYVPTRCQYRLGCNELSAALAEHGYWDNMESGEWVSQKAHLCQKHIDYVKKDKESK